MVREIPQPLFKFVTASRAIKILEDRTLRFTQPHLLNDPFEMQVQLSPSKIKSDLQDIARKGGQTDERSDEFAKRNLEGTVINLVEHLAQEKSKIGVLSLSETSSELLLWSHYADEHRGVSIGLRFDTSLVPSSSNEDKLVWIDDVKYSSRRDEFKSMRESLIDSLYRKSENWVYEREWRIVRTLNTLQEIGPDVYVSEVRPKAIQQVILGARMYPDEEARIVNILKADGRYSHVEILKSTLRPDSFQLELIPLSEWASRAIYFKCLFGDNWRDLVEWVSIDKLRDATNY